MVRYQERGGRRAWKYTHAWREIPVSAWQGANVLASCENLADVRQANALGYVAELSVPKLMSRKMYVDHGLKVVPCPSQAWGRTCVDCRMCLDVERLRRAGITIALEAHGPGSRALRDAILIRIDPTGHIVTRLRESVRLRIRLGSAAWPAPDWASPMRARFAAGTVRDAV